ncbi:MAG: HNH endonuclease [Corynebacterium sp.]|nr:HNH endonuclease [Corynebacterium sp.]MDN6386796.1 HNH endonuclease [Corynebacterium sp.]
MTTTDEPATVDIDALQRHINIVEMGLIIHLRQLPASERLGAALALRGRSRNDATRFAHAGELAARNLELFCAVVATGILAADHLALIRRMIHAQLSTVPKGRHDEITACLDAAVNTHVTPWLRDTTRLVTLRELGDRVRAAILDAAPVLADNTAQAQEDTVTLKRRGNKLILTGGDEITLAAIDDELDKKARVMLADARRLQENLPDDERSELPTRSQLKAQVMLEQLGDNPNSMEIRVHLYRATIDGVHGTGAGYVAGVGWINPATAERFEGACDPKKVKEIPIDPQDYPESPGYPFLLGHRTYMEGRDATCRFPYCDVPATLCDNDHIINSPHTDPTSDGVTHPSNGQKLCRPHHRLKTEGSWRCSSPDGGFTIHWQGPGGVRYTTHATGPLAQVYGPDLKDTGPAPTFDDTDDTDADTEDPPDED